jgi:predicted CXXCH cytochrome family protein
MKWGTVLISFALAAKVFSASLDCASCHDDTASAFKGSIHSTLTCTDCHSSINKYPHPENIAKVNCGSCHADSLSGVAASVHAKVNPQQLCTGCHGDAHTILSSKTRGSRTYPTNLPRTCGACHSNEAAKKKGPMVYAQYVDSIHGMALTRDGLLVAASCSSCHGSHKILAKTDPQSRTFHANIPSTCGTCHEGPLTAYSSGVHGKQVASGNDAAPVCSDCHTAHQIARVQTAAWQMQTTSTCGGCHSEKLATYHDTFHAQVSALGYIETAHCWDCHNFHEILPASNAKSTVARANLPATCGKCHTGVTKSFITYQPHADRHDRKEYPLVYYSSLFMNLLLTSVIGFFLLHTILWLIRSAIERRQHRTRG